MSDTMNKLVKGLQEAIQDSNKKKTSAYDTPATVVRNDGDILWVHIPGGVDETPVRRTINAKPGDEVQVRVSNGSAWALGNATNPPTDDTVAYEAKTIAGTARVMAGTATQDILVMKTVVAEKADVVELNAVKATIGELEVQTAKIHDLTADQLTATVGYIEDLTADNITASDISADHATIGTLDATYATIDDLEANYAHITNGVIDNADIDVANVNNLSANYAHITNGVIDNADIDVANVNNLSANYAHVTNGVIDNAKIGYADVNNLNAHYAAIDLANVNNAWIQSGLIKDAAISDAQIIGVSANKLTAGTIDASNITVTNLNASNITTGSITVDGITIDVTNNEASIDGSYIEDGSITLNGLSQEVTDKIDGAVETFTGTVVPTLNNYPASSWTTTAIKDSHIGDIYYVLNAGNQADGYCYRFAKSGNTYQWVLIKDSDVTAALGRLTTAEGKIDGLESFESTTSSWIVNTDEELGSIKSNVTSLTTRMTTAEGDIATKVDTSTFNTLSQTVGENSSSITTLSTIASNNGLTTSTNISNTVNSVSQKATSNESKISNLTTVLGTNADGTTKTNDIVHQVSAISQDLSGISTRVSKTEVQIKGTYATSSTTAGITNKIAIISPNVEGWELYPGATVTVKFSSANTVASPNLCVKGKSTDTGSNIAIKTYNGGTLTEADYKWSSGDTLTFTYNGTNWLMQEASARIKSNETIIQQTANNVLIKATENDTTAAQGGQHIIQSLINVAPSGVTISADKVNIEGAAIFTGSGRLSQSSLNATYEAYGAVVDLVTDLESSSGTTVINGGHITTGTIDASQATITNIDASNITTGTLNSDVIGTGSISIGKLSNEVQSEIDDAKNTADYFINADSNGILVHPSGDANNGVHITDAVEILRNGLPIASYGETVSIGNATGLHIQMDGEELGFYQGENNKVAYIRNDRLFINQSVVVSQMDVGLKMNPAEGEPEGNGQWSWKVHENSETPPRNNLYLKWIG